MITDNQTNTVYFSNLLPEEHPKEFKELSDIIDSAGHKVKLLVETYDIYCRDYMPVQVADDDYVQFVFRPKAYFKPEEYTDITNPVLVELINNLTQPRYSPIILDGGNVIKATDKVIITDRVFKDNSYQFTETEILAHLEKELKCRVIIIPEYPDEITGHADGLIRFIDDTTVFINETKGDPQKKWLKKFLSVLQDNNLQPVELPCPMEPDQPTAEGLYINYLHVGNLVIVPQFNFKKEDARALSKCKEIFGSKYAVVPCDARWIAQGGGVLNCASWTVKT